MDEKKEKKKNEYSQNVMKKCFNSSRNVNKKQISKTTRKFTSPSLNNISETTAKLVKPFEIYTAHKLTELLHSILSRSKDPTAKEDNINTI
ncbi:unnamed protein product [Trichobilharzia regenti]|nr:unnamed protein product [Trichobilharzia regenti]